MKTRWLFAVAIVALAACRAGAHDAGAAAADPPRRDAAQAAGAPGRARVSDPLADAPCDGSPVALGRGITGERWRVTAEPSGADAAGDDRAACLDLVRIDLARYAPRILAAARESGGARPAPAWVDDFGLVAAINLSMFTDTGAPVALAADARGELSTRDSAKFGGVLAFDPVDAHDPPAQLVGRACPGVDLAALRRRYRAVVASYRLLDCDGGAIAWKDAKRYSAAAVGVDRDGRLVLIHARAPFTMKELSAALARPALRLAGAIFVEGGPEASLVVRADRTVERIGSFETGFVESDDNHRFWDLPNVLGIAPK